jgi:predicted transposase YdaD
MNLKIYRDYKNTVDTAFDEGKIEGKIEGRIEGRVEEKNEGIKKSLIRGKLTIEEIAEDFEVTIEYVLALKKEIRL